MNLKIWIDNKVSKMASFVDAMSAPALTKVGVKGNDVYTEDGVGDARVALFTMLTRGLEESYIRDACQKLVKNKTVTNEFIRDFFVMAFQSRDIRGGKGERDLFYAFIGNLFLAYPQYMQSMMELIPEYGCWKDLWSLDIWMCKTDPVFAKQFSKIMNEMVCKQFRKDWVELDTHSEEAKLSLLAKWLPREGSKFDNLAKQFANELFPSIEHADDRLRAYRKACSEMNQSLKTVEVNMCGGTWRSVEPEKVPGRCLKKNNAAFLNEHAKNHYVKPKKIELPNGKIMYTKGKMTKRSCVGTRYPDNPDRVECAEHFNEFLKKASEGRAKAKGANVVYPHEIVTSITYANTESQQGLLEAQWKSIREAVEKDGQLKSIVPLCDVSGSMAGIPMEVSIALGILISEIAEPAFKDHILTFDTNPTWVSFADCKTLKDKVYKARTAPWGGSTDLQKACNMILQRLVEHKVPAENAPKDMLVLTDMGFDQAMPIVGHGYASVQKSGKWETIITSIRNAFEANGYKAPRIVIWNLRAEYKDFHARADQEGVVMLSGWSPAVLKAIQKNGVEVGTPYMGMRMLLDDKRYDKVREVFNRVNELKE